MFLQRIAPMGTFNQFRREMDRLFEDFIPDAARPARGFPALNVWEDQDQFFVEAEVPGLQLENIEVEVLANELLIRGQRQPIEIENAAFHRRERGTGEFSRRVALPVPVDSTRVTAALKDGILTITLPKAEAAKARKIDVKNGETPAVNTSNK